MKRSGGENWGEDEFQVTQYRCSGSVFVKWADTKSRGITTANQASDRSDDAASMA
ncbi:hypothetical protein [Novipirellula artificiosorum]|uniref:hypothetical protein n=1 Tax=Novipirellula artificiosorum TaxID=2528016 RepID=UPI0018CE5828|nr:hypothetical protein [Novipirellula artificiosorum]